MSPVLALIAGSIAGGLSRYYLGGFVQRASGGGFPYGTLVVNLTGCLLIGFFSGLSQDKLGPSVRLLLMTGFCGAFTTFSAFMLETDGLLKGSLLTALFYVLLSVAAGFAFFRLGVLLAKSLVSA